MGAIPEAIWSSLRLFSKRSLMTKIRTISSNKGTPSKRQAAAEDETSSFVSPSKRTRTPRRADKKDEDGDDVELGRATRLFDEEAEVENGRGHDNKTIKNEKGNQKDNKDTTPFKTPQKPEKTPFFGTPNTIQCSPSVKNAYSIVRRCTGSLGGNGSGGAIYGELTTGSMQKVVNLMIEHCDLGTQSIFIDVGAGLGKPNIHVAQYPGVAASYGIEHEHVRWQLSLHNLKHLLQAASEEEAREDEDADTDDQKGRINHKIFFHFGDITGARTLDPFTHIYMFDIGFPPALFYEIADRFNISQSPYLICYHGPKLIVERYGFNVELLTQVATSMHGSSEGHTAYFYKRAGFVKKEKGGGASQSRMSSFQGDPLFNDGLNMIRKGTIDGLYSWVKKQMDSHFTSPRPARRRRSAQLFLHEV